MARTYLHHVPPIEIAGTWRNRGRGPHDDVEVRVAYGLLHLDTVVHFLHGIELTAFALWKKEDEWVVMLKGQGPRKPMIAWLHAPTFKDALVMAATACDSSHVDWAVAKPRKKP